MAAKVAASRLAPPTSAPSTSGCPMQLGGVLGPHRAPVLDADGRGRLGPGQPAHHAPDVGAGRLGVRGGGGPPRADGPDGLVGDDEPRHLLGRRAPSGRRWSARSRRCLGLPVLALLLGLAHAHDGRHGVAQHGPHGGRHHLVGLAEELPALGVARRSRSDTPRRGQHGRGDLTGEGPLVLVVSSAGRRAPREWRGPRSRSAPSAGS